MYLDAGVRLIWIVDPKRRVITVYPPNGLGRTLRQDDALDGGNALPGFTLPVADLSAFE